ncbi:alpha-ketoacid dehydrogenase subunit alpha/beta [soil metagenome]
MNRDQMLDAYERMQLIRQFEERVSKLYADGEVPGFVHLSIGQEAVAVGALHHLRTTDVITSTHRGHGHAIAKGLDVGPMLAELMGKETGTCQGRGGSMHVADPSLGIFGANGIVGAGLPIAVGAAQAFALRKQDGVVVAFFGDGAVATGAFHEAMNLAALWKLPVIFLCENNQYSEFSRATDQHPVPISQRALGYGMPFHELAGNDLAAMADAMSTIIDSVRAGAGPVLVEAVTNRWHGHYEGDQQRYRGADEIAALRSDDPLVVSHAQLVALGVEPQQLVDIEARVAARITEAEVAARAASEPAPETAADFMLAPRAQGEGTTDLTDNKISLSKSVRQALTDALADDEDVYLAGIDVGGGNVFGLTRGLAGRWPDRVLDTPISETAIMGLAVGSAMAGKRPVVELMYLDFLGVCFDQILNQAAKLRFMTGGKVTLPLVIRTQFGSGRSSGSQHSQSLEVLFAHIPGLTVVMPSNSADAYGLLRTAIEDDNPVLFIENRNLYEKSSAAAGPQHRVPFGKAAVLREGTDATIVAWSRTVYDALDAAETLAAEGISAEVIDLRTIVPLDREAILTSLAKTNRLVIAHDAVTDFGVGAEIAALAVREGFWSLDAPVERVGAAFTPAPYAPSLESVWMPSATQIHAKVVSMLAI